MGNTMSALLIKDWKLMNSQRQFWAIVVFFYVIFTATQQPSFAIGYCTVMLAFCTLTTLSFDEFENGAAYLFTLPFSRKDYVKGKYLFAFLITAVPWLVMNVLSYIISSFREVDLNIAEFFFNNIATLFVGYVMLALELPLQLKYGSEKSRIVLLSALGIGFILAYLLYQLESDTLENIADSINRISIVGVGTTLGIAVVVMLVLMWISYQISVCIVERRQF